jgi:hypothetical protein
MVLVVVFYLGLTYSRWWMAPTGSVLIFTLAQLAWPERDMEKLGLNVSPKQIGISLFLLGLVSIGSIVIVRTIAPGAGTSVLPVYQNRKWAMLLVHTLGQTLNEEMVLGVLLLRYVTGRFRSLNLATVSEQLHLECRTHRLCLGHPHGVERRLYRHLVLPAGIGHENGRARGFQLGAREPIPEHNRGGAHDVQLSAVREQEARVGRLGRREGTSA